MDNVLQKALEDSIKIAIQSHLPHVSMLSRRLHAEGGVEQRIMGEVDDLAMDMAIVKHMEVITPEYARAMAEKMSSFARIYADTCKNDTDQLLMVAVINSFRLCAAQLMGAAEIL